MDIVNRIKEKCAEQGTSIKAVEREIGLGNGTISRWNTSIPSYDKIMRVADYLHVSFYWLISGEESQELSSDERRLIEYYRKADGTGKTRIMTAAQNEAPEQSI